MAKKRVSSLRCPTCRKPVPRGAPEFPFCSERCRRIDLGKWASGSYVISTPIDRGDESGEADYTTGLARLRQGSGGASSSYGKRSQKSNGESESDDDKLNSSGGKRG